MRIPRHINVLGQKWKIVICAGNDEMEGNEGLCDHPNKIIYIRDNVPKKLLPQVLMHECLHALFYRTGIDQGISGEVNEIISDSTATWITETFKLTIK